MYRLNEPVCKSNHVLGKLILVVLGTVIGVGLGLYVAILTFPMSQQTTIYILRSH